MYTLFVVLDSLILAAKSWYLLMRISLGEKETSREVGCKQFLFKMMIIYIGDVLEFISNSLSIVSYYVSERFNCFKFLVIWFIYSEKTDGPSSGLPHSATA